MARVRSGRVARLFAAALMGLGITTVVISAAPTAGAAAPSWQSRTLPWTTAGPVQGTVAGVSCASPIACVAVGTALLPGATANTGAFVATLHGGRWAQGLLPLPAGAPSAELSGVSCASATYCVAVGSYGVMTAGTTVAHSLVEKFDGSTWTPLVGLDPVRSSMASLSGVSCPFAGSCTASGTAQLSPGPGPYAFVARLAKGAWTEVVLPLPSGVTSDTLTSVSCPTPTSCAAVGTTNVGVALLEVGAAAKWKATLASAVSGSTLASVSCASAGSCVAVGTHGSGWAERLTGTTWTADTALPSSAPLTSVSCPPGSTTCTAWGPGPVVETLSAGIWGLISSAGLPSTSSSLAGTCPSATVCMAFESAGFFAPHAMAVLTGSGSTWTSAILPGPSYAGLDSVSCSPVRCAGVGRYYDASAQQFAVVVELSGGRWVPVTYPLPTSYNFYPSVSCVAKTCVVVSGQSAAVSTGKTWTVQSLPTPAGFTGFLDVDAVSCASAGSCVAVGTPLGAGNRLFAETLAGGIWTATLLPSSLGNGTLAGISCVSTTKCTAVGSGGPGGIEALVEQLSGTTWTEDVLPAPPGATYGQLGDVSCTSTTDCVAVGAWFPVFGGTGNPLSATLSGGTWTQTPVVAPAATFYGFASVACPATGTCTGLFFGQAMQLSAGAWSPVAVPLPAGTTSESLSSVRCIRGSWCVIAGQAGGPAPTTGEAQLVPLISTLGAPVPSITSAPLATAAIGVPASITLRATSTPAAAVSVVGTLPAGFTVVASGNGTALLSGTATAGEVGSYHLTVVADNGLGAPASQGLTLTVA